MSACRLLFLLPLLTVSLFAQVPPQLSGTRPLRIWINDDSDFGDTIGDDIPGQTTITTAEGNTQVVTGPDALVEFRSADGTPAQAVHGNRDLIDFFPVFLEIKELVRLLHPGDGLSYKLRQADGAVNFVYTSLTAAQAMDYQRPPAGSGPLTTGFGDQFTDAPGVAAKHQVTAAGFELSADFLNRILNTDQGVILIEGRRASVQPLVVEVDKADGTTVAQLTLPLQISPVEQMFRHVDLRDVAFPDLAGAKKDSARPDALGDPAGYPDGQTGNDRAIIFVHGYNVGGQRARGWEAEMFKRLYWSHSHARFLAVSWFGNPDDPDGDGPLPADYHLAVRNAFTTAPHLAAVVNRIAGPKTVIGHSLGCMVVASALADFGMTADHVCFVDAAIAREAFDGPIEAEAPELVRSDWALAGYDPQLYASNWFQLFGSADARSRLTWRFRFQNLTGDIHNFYSSTEEVLAKYTGEVPTNAFEALLSCGDGSYAWAMQEKSKGRRTSYLLDSYQLGTTYGGWGFNLKDPYTEGDPLFWKWADCRVPLKPDEIGHLDALLLRRQPFFEPGFGGVDEWPDPTPSYPADTLAMPGAPKWILDLYGDKGSDAAADFFQRAQLLAEAIPAQSWPAGANSVGVFHSSGHQDQNYNMPEKFFSNQAYWPRDKQEGTNILLWHHNDLREIAYLYLYPIFDKFVSISNQ